MLNGNQGEIRAGTMERYLERKIYLYYRSVCAIYAGLKLQPMSGKVLLGCAVKAAVKSCENAA